MAASVDLERRLCHLRRRASTATAAEAGGSGAAGTTAAGAPEAELPLVKIVRVPEAAELVMNWNWPLALPAFRTPAGAFRHLVR